MHANSSPIVTSQQHPHEDLARRVARALSAPWRKPPAAHTCEAFAAAERWRHDRDLPLILDAGCGVGASTHRLAARFPDHAVVGIDRSADRLSRDLSQAYGPLPGNALLVRADLVDFWRLALNAGWQPVRHYLLYPNPYPKAAQLKRRWHGHPVFPAIVGLGGQLELRSNWRLYIEEFARAVKLAANVTPEVESFEPQPSYMTPFERKYFESGQTLWRLTCELPYQPSLLPR